MSIHVEECANGCGCEKHIAYKAHNYKQAKRRWHSRVAGVVAKCCGCGHTVWLLPARQFRDMFPTPGRNAKKPASFIEKIVAALKH